MTHIRWRLPPRRDAVEVGLQALRHLQHVALQDVGVLRRHVHRQLGVLRTYRSHAVGGADLTLEQSVVLQEDRRYLLRPVF